MKRRSLLSLAALPLLAPSAWAQAPLRRATAAGARVVTAAHPAATIHSYVSAADGFHVAAHVIEGPSGLVLVDGGLTPAAGGEIRALLDGLGKPLQAVLLSHFHPDHWAGLTAAGLPEVLAGPATAELMRAAGPSIAASLPFAPAVPRVGVQAPGALRLGGVEMAVSYVRDTEAPEIMVVEIPGASAVVVQDIFYNGVHAYVSRRLEAWIAALRGLESRGDVTFLVGHGEPATAREIPRLVSYLEAVQPMVATGPVDQRAVVAEMVRRFPDFASPELLALSLGRLPPG
ncbi:MBL fold metallo-hydrolase [Falsiroseomonas sp. HW251]|uniref:MBL fold metallo-hydrolase n=1 Tax=Falsiroseomonas sp. HW251 TaxID=3390998 RepID=UPI003D316A2E